MIPVAVPPSPINSAKLFPVRFLIASESPVPVLDASVKSCLSCVVACAVGTPRAVIVAREAETSSKELMPKRSSVRE